MELTHRFAVSVATVVLLWTSVPSAEPVAVRHIEGLVHGFLSLRSPEGTVLAYGDLIQDMRGGRINSRLVYHLKTGPCKTKPRCFRSVDTSY
jgi:hypothetical protein